MFNTKIIKQKGFKMELILKVSTREDAEQAVDVLKGFIRSLVPQPIVSNGKETTNVEVEIVVEEKPVTRKRTAKVVEPEIEDDEEIEEKPVVKTKAKKIVLSVKDIQELAKQAVAATTKEETKAIISKYGVNISSIDESDYSSLKEDLEALIAEVI
jgi:hypothetical protein